MTRPAISLGLTAAPVVTIPARQARAFRVIDNRTSELTSWDTDLLPDALFSGQIAYVWMSSLALPVTARGLDACGFVRRSLIIWDKGHIVIGRGHYHWRHETCWYAVKKGAQANWAGDRKASTLWEIDNPRKSETGHSAQKPVECMQRAIHNHKGDVYDPFVGSGTTLITGEQEGRSVYAIEIDPAYVDVTVKRWEDFTGRKAERKKG